MDGVQERRWFWATLILSSISIVAVVFAFWELVENHFFREADYVSLHYLYISRGIASSLLLAFWAGWYVLRQRRAAEENLRRSREHYRALVDNAPGAVILFDDAWVVSEWNAAAERLYGYTRSEVLGAALPTIPADKYQEMHELMRQVQTGQPVLDVESFRCHKDGTSFDVLISLLPFREPSGHASFMEVSYDNRERVRLRQTLLEVEKLTSMGKMAAGTAHHLNTPLAAMLLRVQMMRERVRESGVARDLEQFEQSIKQCQLFVRRLLDFSRRPLAQKQPEPVTGVLEAVLGFLGPTFTAKRVQCTTELERLSEQLVMGDRNQLESLFLTLLSNALDAFGPEGGTISIRALPGSADRVGIAISDTGCGIAPGDLNKLFEPFFTTKPTGKGTGLGLAIAKNIVQEHGGSIRIESNLGTGTTVIVELPLYQPLAACVGEAP
jgi:PAS domain S-box-containing protein